jgi:hypothetical protein
MTDELKELKPTIDQALARFTAWEKPLRRYRAQEYRRLNADGFTWEAYQNGLAKLEAQLALQHDPRGELYPLFERLCAAYSADHDDLRASIRAFAAERKKLGGLLWRFANHLAGRISGEADARLVQHALAALSIENCPANYRDTLMTLADVYVAAENAGIDPRPLFAEAAVGSTDEVTAGGCESLAAIMRDFHASSVLRERRAMGTPYGGPT